MGWPTVNGLTVLDATTYIKNNTSEGVNYQTFDYEGFMEASGKLIREHSVTNKLIDLRGLADPLGYSSREIIHLRLTLKGMIADQGGTRVL